MGVFYHIQPFDKEVASFLRAMGSAVPRAKRPSRNPTPAEIRQVCAELSDFQTTFTAKPKKFWQAIIDGKTRAKRNEGTLLNIDKFSGDEDKPHAIWFEKGSPAVIVEIVKALATKCGPLVLIPDTGDSPIAITENTSVKELLREWDHTQAHNDE